MVRWLRWHCPPDTGFEIRALAVWGRARYLSVTEAPHNTNFHTWMGKKQFCFFQTAETGNRTPDSGVKGSGANHYPRAPALLSATTWKTLQELVMRHQSKIRSWEHPDKSETIMTLTASLSGSKHIHRFRADLLLCWLVCQQNLLQMVLSTVMMRLELCLIRKRTWWAKLCRSKTSS